MRKLQHTVSVFIWVLALLGISCSGSDDGTPIDPDGDCTKKTFYLDSDKDGFGDANSTKSECTQPNGYVEDKTDPDDSNALIFPGCEAKYYPDSDQDGFGDPNGEASCAPLEGYVENSDDLNDEDASIINCSDPQYFLDSDGDGYGDPTKPSCTAKEGYVMDNTDCYDGDNNMHPGIMFTYGKDLDGDGVPGDLDTVEVNACETDSAPDGYYVIFPYPDCDDQNPNFGNQRFDMGADTDGDGYVDPGTVTSVSECDEEYYYNTLQYINVNGNPYDCNDQDANVYPGNGC
jgi:hypothetical protein